MNGICRVVSPFFSVTFGDWKPELHRLRRVGTRGAQRVRAARPRRRKTWRLLILSCASIQPDATSGTLGQLSHGAPAGTLARSVLGVPCQSRPPSSARSPPVPLGRTRAPRGPHVPEPRQQPGPLVCTCRLTAAPIHGRRSVWPLGKRFYNLARQSNRSADVHRQGAVAALIEVKRIRSAQLQ